jgi:hypothetical protein
VLAVALSCAAGVAARAVLISGESSGQVLAAALAAVALFALSGLAGSLAGVVWATGLLAAAYTGALADRGAGLDAWAPAVAAGLIAAAEAAAWAAELRVATRVPSRVVAARATTIGMLAAGAALAGWALLVPAAAGAAGGLPLTAAGLVAAVAVAALVRRLARGI